MLSEFKKKQTKRKPARAKASDKVKDYGNDPFFVKKAEESRSFLEKHGFPKDILLKK
jgi:hypothetical protein